MLFEVRLRQCTRIWGIELKPSITINPTRTYFGTDAEEFTEWLRHMGYTVTLDDEYQGDMSYLNQLWSQFCHFKGAI